MSTESPKPRVRASRACEPCRLRRVKCTGQTPCEACHSSGEGWRCHYRSKARPNRSRSSKFNEVDHHPIPSTASYPESSSDAHHRITPLRPIAFIEDAVKQWAAFNGLDPTGVIFHDSSRVIKQPSFFRDLAQESLLMAFYLETTPRHTDVVSRDKARSIFGRFAALPSSVGDDEQAFLFSVLCKSADMKAQEILHSHGDMEERRRMQELAVGYFHLACEVVGRAAGPSLMTLTALQALTTYAAGRGSRTQTYSLLQKMGWQVRQLGLCKKATAELYDPEDQAEQLLVAVLYQDSVCGILLDLAPQNLISDLDWDPSASTPLPISITSLKVMHLEADFMDASSRLDFGHDVGLVLRTESAWTSFLKSVHIQHTTEKEGIRHSFLGWALIRVSMLSIMLRAPLLYHETLGSSSLSIVARSSSTILRVYWDLSLIGMLEPCWVQMRRITTCIQGVILTCAEGHLHPCEARDLLSIGIDLVRKHEPVSDTAVQMAMSFELARNKLLAGLSIPQVSDPESLRALSSIPSGSGFDSLQGLGTMMGAAPMNNAELDWPSFFAGLGDMTTPVDPIFEETPFSILDKGLA